MSHIKISWSSGEIFAELRDTPTAQILLQALPLSSSANVWGDEIYFSLPFTAEAESDASDVVDKGAVCFWLDGDALALLFGPTPVSRNDECRLISPANILGEMIGDLAVLRSVRSGDKILVEAA
ncbi:MAG: hypothetical protein HKP41_19085 [Desulfobacterales bacterium]|nr:hypothetical protein [Desulfobacterales bacterium]